MVDQHDNDEGGSSRPTPEPVAPSWLGDLDPDDGAASAILVAAARLFSERSPSKVTLREIAESAGVNYGLIHHYFGTKDAVLSQLIRRASAAGASAMAGTSTLPDALGSLVDVNSSGAHTRMLAWVLLSDTEAARSFTPSPAMRHLARVAAATGDGTVDPNLLAAVLTSALMGWQLFRPFVVAGAELDDHDPVLLNAAFHAVVRAVAEAVLTPGGEHSPRPS